MHFAIKLPTMMAFGGVVIFAATFLLINSQLPPLSEMPEECRLPSQEMDNNPFSCCDTPGLFSKAAYAECGLRSDESQVFNGLPDCSKELCLLRKYNLLTMNNEIDKQRVGAFIDNWAAKYPAFIPAIVAAKEACLTGKPLPGPPQACDAKKLVVCLHAVVFKECPVWRDTTGCGKVKAYVELCRRYFPL